MRAAPTNAEAVLRRELKALKCGWKTQHVVDCRYILDFFHKARRICVEVDGPYHLTPEQRRHDRERSRYLQRRDILVLRFSNAEVIVDPRMVVAQIMRVYRGREYMLR